jgi:hypothetical protein
VTCKRYPILPSKSTKRETILPVGCLLSITSRLKRTCGGTAASAVELDDIPDFDRICENHKAQREIERKRKDAILGGKHLAVSELEREKAKKKARKWALKAKADQTKAAAVTKMTGAVDRSNFLSMIALYDKMGMHDKAREHLELYTKSALLQKMISRSLWMKKKVTRMNLLTMMIIVLN